MWGFRVEALGCTEFRLYTAVIWYTGLGRDEERWKFHLQGCHRGYSV